jgi:2-keto-4-pentenoate hydratase/2-oxohepta-3-ene-1,7-dioic acid hydratase in catechol pathway
MIHGFDKIIAYVSNYFSLNIGDVIFTGTPKGVGECVVGDELEGFLGDSSMFKLLVQ